MVLFQAALRLQGARHRAAVVSATDSLNDGFDLTGFADQVRGNGAEDNARHLAHDGGLTGKQKAQREWNAKHPRQLLLHLIHAIPGDN